MQRHTLLQSVIVVAMLAAIPGANAAPSGSRPVIAPQDASDITKALRHAVGDLSIYISVDRQPPEAPNPPGYCTTGSYTDNNVVEHPFIGYVAWINWAVKSGIVEYRTLSSGRCPFVVEHELLTDYRAYWELDQRLRIILAVEPNAQVTGFKQSTTTVNGVPNVPTFDLVFDIVARPDWPGITLTPSATHSTMRLIRDPGTQKIVVVKAELQWPTVKLAE